MPDRSIVRTVLGTTSDDWRTRRRADAAEQIVAKAWELARENGLAGLSLRDLARRLGMAAPSLYSYFDSKNALYDAMYADGWRSVLALGVGSQSQDVRTALLEVQGPYVQWAVEDPVRYQLLNQRTIPGFEPSPESYAIAQEAYDLGFAPIEALVELTQEDRDLLTALIAGLLSQQFANDPGGTRWVRLLDDLIDLIVPRFEAKRRRASSPEDRPQPSEGDR
jgi:AcrR family transcriptional regulator